MSTHTFRVCHATPIQLLVSGIPRFGFPSNLLRAKILFDFQPSEKDVGCYKKICILLSLMCVRGNICWIISHFRDDLVRTHSCQAVLWWLKKGFLFGVCATIFCFVTKSLIHLRFMPTIRKIFRNTDEFTLLRQWLSFMIPLSWWETLAHDKQNYRKELDKLTEDKTWLSSY